MAACMKCREEMSFEATFCPHCGHPTGRGVMPLLNTIINNQYALEEQLKNIQKAIAGLK